MAATTGIVGASVIMLTLIALPTMLAARLLQGAVGRHHRLGRHAGHPDPAVSIMLVIMGDLMTMLGRHAVHRRRSFPGLLHVGRSTSSTSCILCFAQAAAGAAARGRRSARRRARELWRMVLRSFLPPAFADLRSCSARSSAAGRRRPRPAASAAPARSCWRAWNKRLNMKMLQRGDRELGADQRAGVLHHLRRDAVLLRVPRARRRRRGGRDAQGAPASTPAGRS